MTKPNGASLRLGLAVFAAGLRIAAAAVPATPGTARPPVALPGAGDNYMYRHYNACAQVNVFGITVFSRCGVGGGFAEIGHSDLEKVVTLQFVSGTTPDQAHGLNRMGLIQEVVREEGVRPLASSYFGFITSSGEESVSQAKHALEAHANGKRVAYSVAEGRILGSSMSYSVYRIELPSTYHWSNASEMLAAVSDQLRTLPADRRTFDVSATPGSPLALSTFLYAMRSALLSTAVGRPGTRRSQWEVIPPHLEQSLRLEGCRRIRPIRPPC